MVFAACLHWCRTHTPHAHVANLIIVRHLYAERLDMPNYGIIDLGSNTVRMCIYEVYNNKQLEYRKKKDFRTLINHKVMAGLAAHVIDSQMTEQGIKHAIDVLSNHLRRAEYFACERLDIFATAVLRNCSNSREAILQIERSIGRDIHLLSCADEAHLGFVGALSENNLEEGTLIDIGGGSTEITRITAGQDFDNISIGQGSLSSYADFVSSILPTAKEAQRIVNAFEKKRVEAVVDHNAYRHSQFYGVGGSVRAAAKLLAEIKRSERPRCLSFQDLELIARLYQQDPSTLAHLAVKATPDRVHTLIPGCLIMHHLMQEFDAKQIQICGGGVREGYLIERILKGSAKR